MRGRDALQMFSIDAFKGTDELKMSVLTRTKSHQFVCIESTEKEKRIIFLIQVEKDQTNNSVLLVSGEYETAGFQLNNLIAFFKGQVEADEKAFKRGIIQEPIYETLRIVSKFIENRNTQFSITFTGKRWLVYHNTMTEHMITVNPKDGWFMLDNSKTKYDEYMPTVSNENLCLLDISADRLSSEFETVIKSDKIKETWRDCELAIYLGRNVINILCGRGEETKKRKIINKVGNDITVQEDPIDLTN